MDPRERFSATVEDYRRHRPDYPEGLFDWWIAHDGLAPGDVIVDVGAGTGIASRQIAARGLRVIAVEPNEDMLRAARAEGGDVEYVRGDAETLTVEAPVAAIVCFQALHWIDLDRALPRFRAALRDRGRVLAVWNLRDERDPLMAAYEAMLRRECPDYASVGAEPRAEEVAAHPGLHDLERATFPHAQPLDRAGFHGRAWSSSYVKSAIHDPRAFDAELDALFDAHAVDDHVRFVYGTVALSFR